MSDEERQLKKLDMLMAAMETAEAEEDAPDFVQELKDCAFTIVWENPGIDRSEWIDELIRQYPSEVVDAYGTNPPEVYLDLSDLWEDDYTDPRTGECASFSGWSEYLATDPDALQERLEKAEARIKELENEVALLREANIRLSQPPKIKDSINPRQEGQTAADNAVRGSGGIIQERKHDT